MGRNMSKTTDIEKKNLEAHVELCAERYAALENKLDNLDERMTVIERHVVEIKDSITNKTGGINKQMITIGTTIVGVMFTAVISLLIHLASK
jgi:predicted  nucleic acid-binding Zn-ribbon protein